MEKTPEEIILRESRKAFFFVYSVVVLTIVVFIILVIEGIRIPLVGWGLAAGIVSIGLAIPEINRTLDYCVVTQKKVVVWSGLLHRKHESFYVVTITDVLYHQNIWQRILNYGPVIVRTFSHVGKEIQIGNIDHPHEKVKQMVYLFDKEMPGGSNENKAKDI